MGHACYITLHTSHGKLFFLFLSSLALIDIKGCLLVRIRGSIIKIRQGWACASRQTHSNKMVTGQGWPESDSACTVCFLVVFHCTYVINCNRWKNQLQIMRLHYLTCSVSIWPNCPNQATVIISQVFCSRFFSYSKQVWLDNVKIFSVPNLRAHIFGKQKGTETSIGI